MAAADPVARGARAGGRFLQQLSKVFSQIAGMEWVPWPARFFAGRNQK